MIAAMLSVKRDHVRESVILAVVLCPNTNHTEHISYGFGIYSFSGYVED